MILQIDEDGPVAWPPPPRPLVHTNALRSRGHGRWGCPHQPQPGSGARPPLDTGRKPGACLATESQAPGPQMLDEPQRPARPRSRKRTA